MIDAKIGYGYAGSKTSVQFIIPVGIEKTGSASATISVTPSTLGSWQILGDKVIHGNTQ